MLGKSTPDTSDEGHSGSNPLSGDPQIERSNWLPFYRPYSFASQPFDCFAEDIQFSGIFLIGKNCMRMKKVLFLLFTRQKQHPEILSGHSKIIISEKQLAAILQAL